MTNASSLFDGSGALFNSAEAKRIHLPQELLENIVSRIVGAVPTEAIYIFGSYARGEERPDSDIDIYVVTKDGDRRTFEYGASCRMALRDLMYAQGISYDLLTSPPDVHRRTSKDVASIPWSVAREGVKVYG